MLAKAIGTVTVVELAIPIAGRSRHLTLRIIEWVGVFSATHGTW